MMPTRYLTNKQQIWPQTRDSHVTYLLLVIKTVSFYIQVFSEIQSVFSFLDELQPQKEWPDLDRQVPHT